MITRDDCQVTDVNVQPPTISDHGLVIAAIPFIHQPVLYITRQVRRWKSLDREALAAALRNQPLFSLNKSSSIYRLIIIIIIIIQEPGG